MNDNTSTDAFTEHVLRRIAPEVRASLSPGQSEAIADAIRSSQSQKQHPIDIRGFFPLFFARYYFVFFMGRDQRRTTRAIETERRQKVALAGKVLFFISVFSPFILLIFLFLYVLKSVLGIDIFPNRHFWEILSQTAQ